MHVRLCMYKTSAMRLRRYCRHNHLHEYLPKTGGVTDTARFVCQTQPITVKCLP